MHFDQKGNPNISQFQQPNNQQQQGGQATPQLDPVTQQLLKQNQLMAQQLQALTQAVASQQQQASAPQPPKRPENFNPHDMFNPDTETGKWYQAQREYENRELLQNVGSIMKEEIGKVKQESTYDQQIQQFANQKGISYEEAVQFKQFMDDPQADLNTLYEVFRARHNSNNQQENNNAPEGPVPQPNQTFQPNVPKPNAVTGNPQGVPTGQSGPPPVNQVTTGDNGMPTGRSFADAAREQGYGDNGAGVRQG